MRCFITDIAITPSGQTLVVNHENQKRRLLFQDIRLHIFTHIYNILREINLAIVLNVYAAVALNSI